MSRGKVSGKYGKNNTDKAENTIKYDYFEIVVNIGGKTRLVPLVKYSKRIDGTICAVEAVPMISKKTIEIFDVYMQKK